MSPEDPGLHVERVELTATLRRWRLGEREPEVLGTFMTVSPSGPAREAQVHDDVVSAPVTEIEASTTAPQSETAPATVASPLDTVSMPDAPHARLLRAMLVGLGDEDLALLGRLVLERLGPEDRRRLMAEDDGVATR